MNLQNTILNEYPLAEKIACNINCYLLEKKRYLVFWETLITKDSINQTLNILQNETQNSHFSKWKTLIVVGKTKDDFKKDELFYFDGDCTFVAFLLLSEDNKKVFMNDSWIFALGCNFRKHVRKIGGIIKQIK